MGWAGQPSGILWIEGKAGSGKSVLAKTIRLQLVTEWGTIRRAAPLPQVSDWFYSSRHGDLARSHMSFMRSILAQLLEQNQDAFSSYATLYRDKKRENSAWKMEDYEQILRLLAARGLPTTCIVDALDESEVQSGAFCELRQHVVELLTGLVDTPSSRFRIIVLSRYTPDIDRCLRRWSKQGGKFAHISLERENAGDIAYLVDHGLAALESAMDDFDSESDSEMDETGYLSHRIPKSEEPSDEIFSRMRNFLSTNAQGVILWVKLVTQALIRRVRGGWYNAKQLEAELKALPRDLSHFYKLIMEDLEAKYPGQLDQTRNALMWVVGAAAIRPLALDEMFEALCIPAQMTAEFDSAEDPLTRGESSIQARTWTGFYRQLRVR